MKVKLRGLYGMVDLAPGGRPAGRLARALLDGGVTVLQLRMKAASAAAMLAVLDELRPLCRLRGATLIVNDRLDVALAGGADGVHLGQEDLPLAAARAIAAAQGPAHFAIGISTHNEAQVLAAADGGADYVGFGPIFPTVTKVRPDPVVGIAGLERTCRRLATVKPLPIVAIGGIALDEVAQIAAAGASAVALISEVNFAPDVAAAARRVNQEFERGTAAHANEVRA